MSYQQDNVFAKIIDGTIPVQKMYEDDEVIAIKDIKPAAKIHILVIPKGGYIDFDDFIQKATKEEVVRYFQAIAKIIKDNNISNYRLVSNKGSESGQSIFHFHTHILSGFNDKNLINESL